MEDEFKPLLAKKIHDNTLVWQKSSPDNWKKIKRQLLLKKYLLAPRSEVLSESDDDAPPPPPAENLPNALSITEEARKTKEALQSKQPITRGGQQQEQNAETKKGGKDKNWYFVTRNETSAGPVTMDDVKKAFADKAQGLSEKTLVWHAVRHANKQWMKAKDVKDLWEYVNPARMISPPIAPPRSRSRTTSSAASGPPPGPPSTPPPSRRKLRDRKTSAASKPKQPPRPNPSSSASPALDNSPESKGSPEEQEKTTTTTTMATSAASGNAASTAATKRRLRKKKRHQLTLNGTFEVMS
eukprot:jgi/Bigna1/79790/fgenesh1_pg.65_\